MDAIKVARSSWRRPSSAKTTEEGQRQLHEQAASAEENGPDGGSVRGGQVCPRHRGGLLAARPSGKRRGREAAKARRVRRRRGRGRGKHGIKGQYTTTRPHRLTVVHRGHLIGPKPDNRCSAWAVLFPCLRVPGGPALGVTRSPWLGQGAVTRFEDGGGLSYLTGANGRTDLALQRQWAREWRRGAHEGREGGRRDLAPGSSGMLWW